MAEPLVIDIREGLSPEAIDLLRRANRVHLALKDRKTGLLGVWTEAAGEEAEGEEAAGEASLTVLVMPQHYDEYPKSAQDVRLDIPIPADSPVWQRICAAMQPGDRLRIGHSARPPGFALVVQGEGGFDATFSLITFWRRRLRQAS